MNNKGFTMVELLVAMAIMGLLIIMAFPTIRAIQTNNTDTKYKEYGKAAISAAKLYIDSYSEDVFDPEKNNEYQIIPLKNMETKDLLKDVNVSGSTCIDGSSVRVVKYNNDYDFCLNLHCKAGGKSVYDEVDKKGTCKDFNSKIKHVYYHYMNNTPYEFETFIGDDTYQLLDPARMGRFKFGDNQENFKGWTLDSNPNPTSTIYKKGTIYPGTIDNDIHFYAYTEKWHYKINYKKNSDGTYSGSTESTTCTCGSDCTLRNNGFSRTGYHFAHWKKDSNTTFTMNENVKTKIGGSIKSDWEQVNLTGIFEINQCTVTYSPNGGKFNNNANNVTQTQNYGTYFGDATNGMRNAKGGTYNATRAGYFINSATAWSGGIKGTYDETKRYLAQDVCNLSSGNNSTTLKVNWIPNPPTCTITAGRTPDFNGWYNKAVNLTLNISGTATSYGIDDSNYIVNSKKVLKAEKEGKNVTYYGYVANAGGYNTCSLKIKLDKTPPIYKGKDKEKDNTYNYWYIYYKDELSGLTKVNNKTDRSRIYYCYGTNNNCSRQCGKTSEHDDNKWKGPDGYFYRKADIYINFIRKDTTTDYAGMETYNSGCQNGKYIVEAWISICDIAGNCEDCGSGGHCKKKSGSERKYRKFTWDFR